mmetsp:Transcript_41962/g.69358  ORF Transcript_41962/g.69358 Transcript_41962/m.69358 type:complete len:81 (-) Transcript_41962:39-281(-)
MRFTFLLVLLIGIASAVPTENDDAKQLDENKIQTLEKLAVLGKILELKELFMGKEDDLENIEPNRNKRKDWFDDYLPGGK